MVKRQIELFNLDVIISVGYRVNTQQGIKFRQWANRVLKEYLLRGYSINHRIESLEQRVSRTEEKIDFFVRTSLPPQQGIFYDGQVFDAYQFTSDLIRKAHKAIVLIDNYVDDTVLTILDKRSEEVSATIYTQRINQQLKLDLERHNAQYGHRRNFAAVMKKKEHLPFFGIGPFYVGIDLAVGAGKEISKINAYIRKK